MFFKEYLSFIKSLLFVAIGFALLSGQTAFGTIVPLTGTQQQHNPLNVVAQIWTTNDKQSQDTPIIEKQTPMQPSFLDRLAQTKKKCTMWIKGKVASGMALGKKAQDKVMTLIKAHPGISLGIIALITIIILSKTVKKDFINEKICDNNKWYSMMCAENKPDTLQRQIKKLFNNLSEDAKDIIKADRVNSRYFTLQALKNEKIIEYLNNDSELKEIAIKAYKTWRENPTNEKHWEKCSNMIKNYTDINAHQSNSEQSNKTSILDKVSRFIHMLSPDIISKTAEEINKLIYYSNYNYLHPLGVFYGEAKKSYENPPFASPEVYKAAGCNLCNAYTGDTRALGRNQHIYG
ncbi:MAG: hypothetical protein US69_C0013G0012 [candidate division TM6 bacterium GW2011_GWF2_38_10]|nr:MAG: hypothetical protein US69_C0013G0012 [candidate division TM6 bacterium GW2011_GWF2_38_10]